MVQLRGVRDHLQHELDRGRASLFMGAGFSSSARDVDGRSVPLGDELAGELFELCFPGAERDESTLQDLFHHALRHHRRDLERLLRARLSIDAASLPDWYRWWFAPRWRRAWTLNVDVVERVVSERFGLDRPIESVSALGDERPSGVPGPDRALTVVHLNGIIDAGCDHVTFATTQYGRRLASRDVWYAELANELVHQSFVFVGTRLDEAPLWQHLEGRDVRERIANNGDAPRSFLVTTRLDRARRCLLQDFSIEWVRASAEDFAREVLARLRTG